MTLPDSAPAVLLLCAAALVTGGHRVGGARVRAYAAPRTASPAPSPTVRTAWVVVGVAAAAAMGWAIGGVAVAVGTAVVAPVLLVLGCRLSARRPQRGAVDGAALAAAWELLDVCLRSGLPVAGALIAAATPLPGRPGVELRRVAGLLELGADPADAWRGAADTPVLAAFARAAGRSAATGAALATSAAAEATRLRTELVDTAQARAQRAAVLLTGPLGLCFLPAFLVLGIAPVVIGLAGEALARW